MTYLCILLDYIEIEASCFFYKRVSVCYRWKIILYLVNIVYGIWHIVLGPSCLQEDETTSSLESLLFWNQQQQQRQAFGNKEPRSTGAYCLGYTNFKFEIRRKFCHYNIHKRHVDDRLPVILLTLTSVLQDRCR